MRVPQGLDSLIDAVTELLNVRQTFLSWIVAANQHRVGSTLLRRI